MHLRLNPDSLTFSIVLGAAVLACSSQRTWAQSTPAANLPLWTVQGTVLNGVTWEPIARALVEEGSTAALTDQQGHFELQLSEGMHAVAVHRPGYRHADQDHAVQAGPNTPSLTFTLIPEITVSGQLLLSTGEAAEAVQILAYRKSIVDNNREKWTPANTITTNADGAFHNATFDRGGNYVFCTQPTQEDSAGPSTSSKVAPAARFGYPPTCYPGPLPVLTGLASGRSPANTLVLTAGQHAEIELPLTREPFYHVFIPIPNAVGATALEMHLNTLSEDQAPYPTDWKAQQGYVEAYLPNGRYSFEARIGQEHAAYGRIEFRVANRPLTAPVVTLLALHPIPVEIHKEFSAQPPAQNGSGQGQVLYGRQTSPDDPGFGLALVPADDSQGNFRGGELVHTAGTSDTSLFQLTGAAPGRYWVETFPAEGYISTITSGGADLTRQPLTIGPGNSTAPIAINLRNDTGSIQATVNRTAGGTSDQASEAVSAPSAGPGELHTSYIYAIPLTRILWQTPQTQSQGADPATLGGLAPGQYKVLAFDHPQQFNLNDPDSVARLANLGQTVTISPGGTANVQLDLIHATGDEPEEMMVDL